MASNNNSSTTQTESINVAWEHTVSATISKRLTVAGVSKEYEAGTIKVLIPTLPSIVPKGTNKEGYPQYADQVDQWIADRMVAAVVQKAKGSYKVSGDTPDTLAIALNEAIGEPASNWGELLSTNQTQGAGPRSQKLWREGFSMFLNSKGYDEAQQAMCLFPFNTLSADAGSKAPVMQDESKRPKLRALVDAFHSKVANDERLTEALGLGVVFAEKVFTLAEQGSGLVDL